MDFQNTLYNSSRGPSTLGDKFIKKSIGTLFCWKKKNSMWEGKFYVER